MTKLDAAYFDQWYTDIVGSTARDEFVRRILDLPPGLDSTGLLGWDAVGEVVAALELEDGQCLLDLGCGRGGYALEIARRTGARAIGVDFSAVAVQQAISRAAELCLSSQVQFLIADLAETGLQEKSIDAVVCIDAMQFADPVTATLQECRRVLVPGGRIIITNWEAADAADERLPPILRHLNLAHQLTAAGFEHVQAVDRPRWRQAERLMAREAAALDARNDPALRSLKKEGLRLEALSDHLRRVLATARAPR